MLWRQITSAAQNFKLGYNIQRPYPWRGITPIVCIFFVGLTILLVLVNIPLSAYDVVQEFTYFPNVTSPSIPFTNIIPTFLRHTAGDFTPQTFRVGDTIQTEFSISTYVIMEAFANGAQVVSFPYYNNPLSSCDVLNISLSLQKEEPVLFSAIVSCWIPSYYKMTLNLSHTFIQDHIAGVYLPDNALKDLDGILMDLEYGWNSENVTLTSKNEGESSPTTTQNVTGIELSVFPCCVCTNWLNESYIFGAPSLQYDPLLLDHPPCDDDVAKFQAAGMAVYYRQDGSFGYMNITLSGNILLSDQELEVPSNVQLVLQNALQAIYSFIRLDLGVSSPNQIFGSPIMFNESISSVSLFKPWTDGTDPLLCDIGDIVRDNILDGSYMKFVVNDSYTNCIRRVRSDIDAYQEAEFGRVPFMPYLRPVFRRKPMLSAISSVFVATFAMVSAAWSLFNFIAGSFCQTQIDVSGCPHCKHCRGPAGDSESVLLSRRSSRYEAISMGEMQEDGV